MTIKHLIFLLALGLSTLSFAQTGKSTAAQKALEKKKQFFFEMDDRFNLSMVTKDSLFFEGRFAPSFINCTPLGEVNYKAQEITTLLKLPLVKVERVASAYDVFKYSEKIATMTVTKKLTARDASVMYVRRTIIYELMDGEWRIVSGQGTFVLPKYIE